jgi:hypothetical protein
MLQLLNAAFSLLIVLLAVPFLALLVLVFIYHTLFIIAGFRYRNELNAMARKNGAALWYNGRDRILKRREFFLLFNKWCAERDGDTVKRLKDKRLLRKLLKIYDFEFRIYWFLMGYIAFVIIFFNMRAV